MSLAFAIRTTFASLNRNIKSTVCHSQSKGADSHIIEIDAVCRSLFRIVHNYLLQMALEWKLASRVAEYYHLIKATFHKIGFKIFAVFKPSLAV